MSLLNSFHNIPNLLYWAGVIALAISLIAKEILGPLDDERARRWKKTINWVITPLSILFLITVISRIAQIIIRFLSTA